MKQKEFLELMNAFTEGKELYRNTVSEVSNDVLPYLEDNSVNDQDYALLKQLMIPNKIIQFRVDWKDDGGNLQTNWGYRVQHSNELGPYKGGLRFDPTVSVDVLQFLALEQTFKNALTGLPLGSGKGGSDFNPKGKSDSEIQRFCESFIAALEPYIGAEVDVPAGDIGVGGKEIGYMVSKYKEITNATTVGALTGKPVESGGSYTRTEATGYGLVYLVENYLQSLGDSLENKKVVISGSGNVATYAAEKAIHMGAQVLTVSQRDGYLTFASGMTQDDLEQIKQCKQKRGSLESLVGQLDCSFSKGKVWQEVDAEVYLPCATQNELDTKDAQAIVQSEALVVAEGANMPSTEEAVNILQDSSVVFLPAKAANAGGVAVSGLEMEQNRLEEQWTFEEVDRRLQEIIKNIFETMKRYGRLEDDSIDYLRGANVGGFVRIFEQMKSN